MTPAADDKVTLVEMAPRDGLQNEAGFVPTADKIALVDKLSAAGLPKIETASFVAPKWVPQMADAAEVLAGITRRPGTLYTALTPNLRGLEGALTAKADEVAIFASASESFSQHNINCSIAESFARFLPMMARASAQDIPVRGYVSCVTDCPYEGEIAPGSVADVAEALVQMGCYEVSLGDTIGQGRPERVDALLRTLLQRLPADRMAGHFHDTAGRALTNIRVCLDHGLRVFDASAGGLGGCPYAPGARGNVATEEVLSMLTQLGYRTDVDAAALAEAAIFAKGLRHAEGPVA